MANEEPAAEELRAVARHAGLVLTEQEARELLGGVARNKRYADVVRGLLSTELEPSPTFIALSRASEERDG